MSALPRRVVSIILCMCVASLMLAGVAVAATADVIADYRDNGVVDRCYTAAEFRGALAYVRTHPDLEAYGNPVDAIQEQQAACASGTTISPGTTTEAGEDSGGLPVAAIVTAAAVVVLAAGVAAFVAGRRRRGSGG